MALASVCLLLLTTLPAAARPLDTGPTAAAQRAAATRVNRAHPRLDSQLNQLVAAGGDAPTSVAVRLSDPAARAQVASWLSANGGQLLAASAATLEVSAPASALPALGAQAGVASVRAAPPPQAMSVVAQGATVLGAPAWNAAGYTGAGVKVGVIDVGFQGLDALLGNELPASVVGHCYAYIGAPTDNVSDCETRQKHGTAVAEALVDVAPDVALYIANPQTTFDLNDAVEWMIGQGVTVINHSVGWGYEGPGDGTSRFSDSAIAAVNAAVAAGIVWINSAGNEGASTWTGAFSDANANGEAEFAPGIERDSLALYAGSSTIIQMRWDDQWGAADRDLDLFLYDPNGNVVRSSTDTQSGQQGQDPYEWFSYTAQISGTYTIGVTHVSGDAPSWLQVQAFTGETLKYHTASHSIGNPAESDNPGLLAVGAAYWNTPTTIEPYSSQGPTEDGRVKPDIVATDGGQSATLGAFYGTSQAAPLVAGYAALLKQRWGLDTPEEIASYITTHATAVGDPPNPTWGYGLAEAPALGDNPNPLPAITALDPPQLAISAQPATLTITGTGFVADSQARWDGADLPTTFVSATQLSVQIPAEDLNAPRRADLYVFNPEPGGGDSNVVSVTITIAGDISFASDHFDQTWQRTDEPVASVATSRTWMWGPGPFSAGLDEQYAEGTNHERLVQYFDKSRMEITTDPSVDPSSIWYVTNGLLSKELITGNLQLGDNTFEQHAPAQVNVAGDPDDANGPTYATFTALLDAPPAEDGATITQRVSRAGTVTDDPTLADFGVTAAYHVQTPGIDHQVASPFWDFMNSSGLVMQDGVETTDLLFVNPFYATGYPITDAYWATVKVGGVEQDVLMQCFERRCLTYTPDNPPGWQVEAGNVGQHYYAWRYGDLGETPQVAK